MVIFCDGEFWHDKDWDPERCTIINNIEYWITKIQRNINRDSKVNEELAKQGWIVLRFWEKDIKKNLSECVNQIAMNIGLAKKIILRINNSVF